MTPTDPLPGLAPLELTSARPVGQDALDPVVAVSPDGSALVAWSRRQGAHHVIEVASRSPKRAFGKAQTISPADPQVDVVAPRAAFANRTAVVAWRRTPGAGGGAAIDAARVGPSGAVSSRQVLATGNVTGVELAADAEGSAVAVWTRIEGSSRRVEAATADLGARFSAPATLSSRSGRAESPRVALHERRGAVVVWSRQGPDGTIIEAARRAPRGAFGAPLTLTSPQAEEALEPQIALDGGGVATVAWTSTAGGSSSIRVATLEGNVLARIQTLPNLPQKPGHPRLAVRRSGAAALAWLAWARKRSLVLVAQRPAQGSFTAPATLAPAITRAEEPVLAIPDHGPVIVVWTRAAGAVRVIQARELAADGTAGPIVALSAPDGLAGRPQLALDPKGNATATWMLARPDLTVSTTVQAALMTRQAAPHQRVARFGVVA